MANRKITEMTAHTAPATDDVLPIIDVSESAATNKNKKITVQELFKGVPDGTAAAPGLAFESDDGNGIYLAGTDTIGISTGGTERVTVNASGDVNISGSLTVAGTTTTIESTTVTVDDKNIELGSVDTPTDVTADGGGITLKGATDKTINWVNSTGYWTFNTGVEVTGDIVFSSELLAADGTAASPSISFSGDTNTGIRRSADDTIQLVTNGIDRVTIDNAGQMGVGNSSPTYSLDVGGSARVLDEDSANNVLLGNQADSTSATVLSIQKARGGTSGPSQITAGDTLGEFRIQGHTGSGYNAGFKIVCDSTTNTSYFAPTTKFFNNNTTLFQLVSDSGTQFNTNIFTSDASNGSLSQGQNGFIFKTGGGRHDLARNIGASSAVMIVFGNAGELKVKGDGDCENTNNRYGGISDSKLKENIVDASSQWDDIKAVQVRNYNFKAETNFPTHTQIGVVAQELETVCPGLVRDNIDEDSDGNDLGTRTKSVAYSVLYMKAVKALQEAMTRIETLEAKVAALEAAN